MFDAVNTAARHIFREKYRVFVPRGFMYSDEYIRQVGYASSGDSTVDRMSANNLMRVNQTIAGWAILHAQGAELLLVDEQDCIPIYKAIIKHLSDWRDFSLLGLSTAHCPPIDDFRALEAIAIHYHVRVQELEPTPQHNSVLRDAVLNMNRGLSRSVINRTRAKDSEDSIVPYISIVDDIEKNMDED